MLLLTVFSTSWLSLLIRLVGWIGAGLLMLAPFWIDTTAGILAVCTGLGLIAIQAYAGKLYNIVFCNVVGIIGYMFNLLT